MGLHVTMARLFLERIPPGSRKGQEMRHVSAVKIVVLLALVTCIPVKANGTPPPLCGYGQEARRPCGDSHAPPLDATAKCRDGTWSFSGGEPHSGTCSGHGGVALFLR
jgi:hypothetical protein